MTAEPLAREVERADASAVDWHGRQSQRGERSRGRVAYKPSYCYCLEQIRIALCAAGSQPLFRLQSVQMTVLVCAGKPGGDAHSLGDLRRGAVG
jgi:hypothetical protein